MNQSAEPSMPSDAKFGKINIELHEMELMESASEVSVANPQQPRKSGSTQKLAPLSIEKDKRKSSFANIAKEPSSNQELLSTSTFPLKKQDSNSSLNDKQFATSPTRIRPHKVPKGYQLASFSKAYDYLQTQGYNRKRVNSDGDEEYYPLDSCGSNVDLKQYGLGIYLYFQFIKRLGVALFLISVVLLFPIILQYQGDGLSSYTKSGSFTMTLAKFTLGNLNYGNQRSYLIVTCADVVSFLIMIGFYLHWKSFHKLTLEQLERDSTILNPASYALSIEGFHDQTTNIKTLEQELRAYIDTLYKGSYEVEVVYNYNGNFDEFVNYDKLIEQMQKQRQIFKQTGKQSNNLAETEKELSEIEGKLQHISQAFEPMYAIIHFRTLRSKLAFINHCKRFKLMKTTGAAIQRAICCTQLPPEKFLFLKKFPLMIRNNKLSRPEEINWRNTDLSTASIVVRSLCSFFFVTIAIIITSALIGFCTLYVASTSSCQSYVAPSTTTYPTYASQIAVVQTQGAQAKFCYCNENIGVMYSDSDVNTFCSSISNSILITNVLQVAASVVSSITNVILSIFIAVISKKLLRPNTIPKEYVFIFWGVLISNYINSAILPLILNASIFGVQFVSYLKFINFMDFTNMSIFSDFNSDWYALVSPYYVTMLIIASFISPIIGLVVLSIKSCLNQWKVRRMCEAKEAEDPVIQKEANEKITEIEFDYPSETAQILLFLFISFMYSGLIPILIPIYTLGLMLIFICKKAMVVKYSIKIPADETLSESILTFLPIIILIHGLFSVWSHTTTGIFQSNAPLISLKMTIFSSNLDRVFNDIIILAEPALIILIILLDLTVFNFIGFIIDCCKDELEMPVQWASVENAQFSERLNKANILGSYKLTNNPKYGHALKAYNELIFRAHINKDEASNDGLNPEHFS